MQRFSEVPEEAIEKMRFSYGRNVAVSAPREIEDLSHQAASMHLCYSFKPSSFMLGMPNEQPKLRVANSRRTRRCTDRTPCVPLASSSHFGLPAAGELLRLIG